jgi:hypothetical protein
MSKLAEVPSEALNNMVGGAGAKPAPVIGKFKDSDGQWNGMRKGVQVIAKSPRGPWIQAGPIPEPGSL